jgi:DNA-binding IclR family transcriptional regulator
MRCSELCIDDHLISFGAGEELAQERNSDRNSIQVIARAAEILRILADEQTGLSLGEIAERTSLARSTVQRIVKALTDEQFLISASTRGGVKLGPLLIRLGASAQVDVAQLVRPLMQNLARQIGESVDLSVLKGASALFVDQVAGTHRLAAISSPGQTFPLHSTANGKALLASLTPQRRLSLLGKRLDQDTNATVTSLEALEKEIAQVQQTGLAYDREEHTIGICAIGTWFTDPLGRPFAISIPVPSVRFVEIDKFASALLETKAIIQSQLLG